MTTECCDFNILKEWVKISQPNSKMIYITGYSANDSILSTEIANYMYIQATKGTIYLVRERKLEDKKYFNYIAVKASPTPVFSLVPLPKDRIEERSRKKPSNDIGAKNGKVYVYKPNYPVQSG